jgi:hypothetical protein
LMLLLPLILFSLGKIYAQVEASGQINDMIQQEAQLKKGFQMETTLQQDINTDDTAPGDTLEFVLPASIIVDEKILIAQNSVLKGSVTSIEQDDLLAGTYKIAVNINSMTTPFGKTATLKAHPILDTEKNKKATKRRIGLGLAQPPDPQFLNASYNKKAKKETDQPFIIPKGTKVNVVLDEDFAINLK